MRKIVIKRGRQRRRLKREPGVMLRAGVGAAALLGCVSALLPAAFVEGPVAARPIAVADARPPAPSFATPGPPPTAVIARNAALPFDDGPNPAARPFLLRASAADEIRSLACLTNAIYYEAASEGEAGQRAVAQVVLNRVRHPAYPASVCGVVYQGAMRSGPGCQFTFTCDGSLARRPAADAWRAARRIAAAALAGSVYAPVGLATHYHADYVLPDWAPRLTKIAAVGVHIFYKWNGAAGTPGAFSQRYAGFEPPPVPQGYLLPARAEMPRDAAALIARADAAGAMLPAVAATPPQVQIDDHLPQSRIRPEFANSGRWRADAPVVAEAPAG